jgi:NitT/TauT family transport system substrate-binding protein
VVAIFATYQTNPQIIMSHPERGFKNLKEVFESPGILAMQSGLSYAQFLKKKFGKPKVKIVPYTGGIGSFLSDKNFSQQGFLTSEPIAAKKAGAKVTSFLVSEEGFNPYTTVVAVREDFLNKNKPQVEAFVRAVRKGWEDYLLNPDKTNAAMGKLNKSMDAETFKKSAEAQVPLIKKAGIKVGSMAADRWENLIQQMLDLKLIKNKLSPAQMYQNY